MVLHPRVNPVHSSSYTHSWSTLRAVCCFASLYVPCVRHLFTCPQPAVPHHHRQTLPYIPNAQTHMAFPSPPYSPRSNTHITPRTTTPYPGSQPCPHAPFAQMYPLGCIFGVFPLHTNTMWPPPPTCYNPPNTSSNPYSCTHSPSVHPPAPCSLPYKTPRIKPKHGCRQNTRIVQILPNMLPPVPRWTKAAPA